MGKVFTADQFTATKFDTAADKAKFANKFASFLLGGCEAKAFAKWFYNRLSNTFGHIAHYDVGGFYATWFSDANKVADFIEYTRRHTSMGDPAYCYVDVERALQSWLARPAVALKIDNVVAVRRRAEWEAVNAEAARLEALEKATSQQYKVVGKSSNTGVFGHRQYVVVARDGSTWKLQIIPLNLNLEHNQIITVPLRDCHPHWGKFYVECPERCPDCPPEVVEKIWAA